MRLYSIYCKDRQRFYKGDDWKGRENWSTTPRFWQTVDGVRTNLFRIGSRYGGETFSRDLPRNKAWLEGETVIGFKRYANFDEQNLQSVEVIVTDVKVLGETRISATELMTVEDAA